MTSLRTNATLLWLSAIVLVCLCSDAPQVRVLSPSEFDVILPPGENGKLSYIRIGINKDIGFGGYKPDYEKENVVGRIIHFSEKKLKIKRGDVIYYSMMFDGNGELYGHTGNYIFNGVYRGKNRRRRQIYIIPCEESSEEDDCNHDSGRYPRHHPPHDHFRHHGPPFGPRQFGPPPMGPPHHHGPGPWDGHGHGHGHDHRDHFGNMGPWDGHGHGHDHSDHFGNKGPWEDSDEEEEGFASFGTKHKHTGGGRRPWHDGCGGHGNGNKNNEKPNQGPGTGTTTDSPKLTTFASTSDSSKSSKTTENSNVEVLSSTSSTAVPNIDIRIREPEAA